MLIEFSVENFRSIKEEQKLSLIKDTPNEMPENFFDPLAPTVPELLNSAVIYGANASGKSNVLKAIECMRFIVEESSNKKINAKLPLEPFLFNSQTKLEPTTFKINFIKNLPIDNENDLKPVRVEYGFSADENMIYEEWLSVYPKGREQSWFHRQYNEDTKSYEWSNESPFFKGQKHTWKKSTRPDQLFLSTAVQLNSKQLKPIYTWFSEKLKIVDRDRIDSQLSKKMCDHDEKLKKVIISLLNQADIDVDDIEIEEKKFNIESLPKNLPEILKKKIQEDMQERLDAYFIHSDELGNRVPIRLEEESDGTQKIFEFSSLIFLALSEGSPLIIDELNKSLHPDLVRFLIRIFNSELNHKHAQLIITTHETSALRKDLLRRDQIWFCEKQADKSTCLYPLINFNPHKTREDIEENYLSGRYGGKPILKKFVLTNELQKVIFED